MKKLPVVSIVGRQNVGKSTLFNAIVKEKKAIVDSFPGLTRDIISYNVNYKGVSFILSDTPGLDLPKTSELSAPILDNAKFFLEQSSIIILLLENPSPHAFDFELIKIVRKLSVPTIIAVNKMDNNECMENMSNFYEGGFYDIIPISALRKMNLTMLLDKTIEALPVQKTSIVEPDISITIVGRPNSGKSTLLNSYLGYNRSVVSPIPGTTRDSVDEDFKFENKIVRLIDTAGIRKKSKINENVEYFSFTRTVDAINKCDIVIHLIDAEYGLTDTDKKISDEIMKSKKPTIIAVNKWDLIDKDQDTFKEFKENLIFRFYKADDFPIISISAKENQRIYKILQTAIKLNEVAHRHIETPKLNKIISELLNSKRLPQLGEKLKIYYATRTKTTPPQFKFFVNNPEFFRKDVIRYFEKALQKKLELHGIPIVINIEGKEKKHKKERKYNKNINLKQKYKHKKKKR